jgi:hypothetical protein
MATNLAAPTSNLQTLSHQFFSMAAFARPFSQLFSKNLAGHYQGACFLTRGFILSHEEIVIALYRFFTVHPWTSPLNIPMAQRNSQAHSGVSWQMR